MEKRKKILHRINGCHLEKVIDVECHRLKSKVTKLSREITISMSSVNSMKLMDNGIWAQRTLA